jgi:hypothetical protein
MNAVIRYPYVEYGAFPAPFVHVSLRCPQTGSRAEELPAQIDTGSDRTILPGPIVRALGLAQIGTMSVAAFGNHVSTVPTFAVEIIVRSQDPVLLKAIASEGEGLIILGRDVLNRYRILLDGPASALEIG